jgi:hypothetical protein
MFGLVLSGGVRSLTLGARDHALINGTMIGEIVTCFRLRDWTCHICGVRLPGLMEVDHLKGHQRCSPDAIAPICQFCHDLRHPVWAVSRKRLFPVLAPGLDQRSLSRFSWSLLAEMTRPGGQDSFEELSGSISERESAAFELLDGDNLESALEAILVIRDRSGQEAARKVAEELDAQIRFLPTCVRDGEPLKRWTPEGFRDVPIELLHEASGPPPDFERLRLAAEELRDR